MKDYREYKQKVKQMLTPPKKPTLTKSREKNVALMKEYTTKLRTFRSTINYYKDIKSKYMIGSVDTHTMKKFLNDDDIYNYYEREYEILTGDYDIKRKNIFIDNYVKYLKSANVSSYMINKFKQLVTSDTIDVIQELDLLPYIKLWGDTKGNTDIDTDEYDNLILNLKQALKTIKKTMAK